MSTTNISKYKILVVDDEKRMVRFIQLNLEQDGFQVVTAYNGEEALDQVRTQLPDLVLLDIMMPDIDGFQVLKKIREVSTVPVIMLTAESAAWNWEQTITSPNPSAPGSWSAGSKPSCAGQKPFRKTRKTSSRSMTG